jgi:hypothetical protein
MTSAAYIPLVISQMEGPARTGDPSASSMMDMMPDMACTTGSQAGLPL